MLGRGKSHNSLSEIQTRLGSITNSPPIIAEELNHFFTNIESPSPCDFDQNFKASNEIKFRFQSVDDKVILNAFRRLKSTKRGGILGVPTYIYQTLAHTLVPAMVILINNCLKRFQFPDIYKLGIVSPIFKKGDQTCPGNYRPISSLPVLSKVFEYTLSEQIKSYLNENGLLSNRQFGFRTGVSTTQMLHFVLDKISLYLDKKGSRFVALASLDIKKAFDTVDHSLLVAKLSNFFNFNHDAATLIRSYLSNRTQCMKVDNFISEPLPITKGVPQGSILGPLLFSLMVSDMLDSYDFAFSYADDTVILAESLDQNSAHLVLSERFAQLSNWYLKNGLTLNVMKTNCTVFSHLDVDLNIPVVLSNTSLKLNKSVTLLGISLDSKLDFKIHVSTLVTRTNQLLYLLRKIRYLLNYEEAKLIYVSIIRPKLEYCASLFTFLNKSITSKIEACQNKAIRIICKAPMEFSITDARKLLNLHTLASRRALFFRCVVHKAASGAGSMALYHHINQQEATSRSLRSGCHLILPAVNSNRGRLSFLYNSIKLLKGDLDLPEYPLFHIDD